MNPKNLKRRNLIRLMSLLGFGGMSAFCVSSCQSTSNADTPKNAVEEQAPESQSDNTLKPELNENGEPAQNHRPDMDIPVTKYGIKNPLPTDVIENMEALADPAALEENEDAELKPELTEEDLLNSDPSPAQMTAKYGAVMPPKKYGIPQPPTRYGIRK